MTLRIPAKVLIHVWSYDFYDMTLSTGKQRRHIIKVLFMMFVLFESTITKYINGTHKSQHTVFLRSNAFEMLVT